MIPRLNVYDVIWFIPVRGDDALVAPAITHVRASSEQLSDIVASGMLTRAVHTPGSIFCRMSDEQVIEGLVLSVTLATTGVLVKLVQLPALDCA